MIQFIYLFSGILTGIALAILAIYTAVKIRDRWGDVAGACFVTFLFAAIIAGTVTLVDTQEQQS